MIILTFKCHNYTGSYLSKLTFKSALYTQQLKLNCFFCYIQVHPPAVEEVNSLLDRLTSDPEEFKTSLAQSSSPEAAQLVMIYSEVMNDQVTVVEVEESSK